LGDYSKSTFERASPAFIPRRTIEHIEPNGIVKNYRKIGTAVSYFNVRHERIDYEHFRPPDPIYALWKTEQLSIIFIAINNAPALYKSPRAFEIEYSVRITESHLPKVIGLCDACARKSSKHSSQD
jgi:hypothetical protein